jgi:hypothetical protein
MQFLLIYRIASPATSNVFISFEGVNMIKPVRINPVKRSQVRNGGLILIGTGLLILGLVTGM